MRLGKPILVVTMGGLLAVAVMGVGSCGDGKDTNSGRLGEGPKKEQAGVPNPDGNYSITCDVRLGNYTEGPHGYRFVVDGSLKNTGNVGIVTEVTARWELKGSGPAQAREIFKIDVDETEDVQITVPATQKEIEDHQSAGSHCRTNVKLLHTFGEPE